MLRHSKDAPRWSTRQAERVFLCESHADNEHGSSSDTLGVFAGAAEGSAKRIHASKQHTPPGGADTGHAPIKRQHRAGNRWGDTHQQSHHPKTGGTRCTGVIPTGTATPPIQARMVYTTLRSSGGNLEERGELFPRLAPYSYNTGIAISPLFLEFVQRLPGCFGVYRGVNASQARHNGFSVFPAAEAHRGSQQVYDTGLHERLGPCGLDRVRESLQAVTAHDQRVFSRPRLRISVKCRQPVLGAFAAFAAPYPQHMFTARPRRLQPPRTLGG